MFNLDFKRIRELMTPSFLRKDTFLASTRVLVSGVQDLHTRFLDFRQNTLFDIGFTSQIIYLEYLLNFKFDPSSNSIYIDNVADDFTADYIHRKIEQQDPFYIYRKSEAQPPIFIKTKSEVGQFDFIVFVGAAVTFNENEMKRTINFYRLAGKRFDIQTY